MSANGEGRAAGGLGALGDVMVSRVGYGAMQLEHLRQDPAAAIALLGEVAASGVTHIDTAQFYGDGFANEMLRRAADALEGVTVVTKIGADSNPGGDVPLQLAQRPEELRRSIDDNRRALGVERLDVVNLRRADAGPGIQASGDQIVPIDDQLALLTELRDEGVIGAIGLSAVDLEGLRAALPAGIVCVQNSYSLLQRDFEDVLQLCEAESVAWVPFFPLGSGFPGFPKVGEHPVVRQWADALGATPAQVGLAWLLQHSPATLLIPGTSSTEHLRENAAAGDLVLPPEAMAALDAAAA